MSREEKNELALKELEAGVMLTGFSSERGPCKMSFKCEEKSSEVKNEQ